MVKGSGDTTVEWVCLDSDLFIGRARIDSLKCQFCSCRDVPNGQICARTSFCSFSQRTWIHSPPQTEGTKQIEDGNKKRQQISVQLLLMLHVIKPPHTHTTVEQGKGYHM